MEYQISHNDIIVEQNILPTAPNHTMSLIGDPSVTCSRTQFPQENDEIVVLKETIQRQNQALQFRLKICS